MELRHKYILHALRESSSPIWCSSMLPDASANNGDTKITIVRLNGTFPCFKERPFKERSKKKFLRELCKSMKDRGQVCLAWSSFSGCSGQMLQVRRYAKRMEAELAPRGTWRSVYYIPGIPIPPAFVKEGKDDANEYKMKPLLKEKRAMLNDWLIWHWVISSFVITDGLVSCNTGNHSLTYVDQT